MDAAAGQAGRYWLVTASETSGRRERISGASSGDLLRQARTERSARPGGDGPNRQRGDHAVPARRGLLRGHGTPLRYTCRSECQPLPCVGGTCVSMLEGFGGAAASALRPPALLNQPRHQPAEPDHADYRQGRDAPLPGRSDLPWPHARGGAGVVSGLAHGAGDWGGAVSRVTSAVATAPVLCRTHPCLRRIRRSPCVGPGLVRRGRSRCRSCVPSPRPAWSDQVRSGRYRCEK